MTKRTIGLSLNCLEETFSGTNYVMDRYAYVGDAQWCTPSVRGGLVISTRKLWYISSFLLERSDLKNVTFEKTPWAPSEVTEVKRGRMVKEQAEKNKVIRKY